MTPHFHRLTIADIRRETPEAVSIAFAVPAELRDAYRFAHGQNVTIKTEVDGEEIRRSYSICSGIDEDELRIAVKRQPGGRFSTHANEALEPGQSLEVMTPTGAFTVPLQPQTARVYLGLACGSGITPLLSIIKTVLVHELGSRFFLIYGNRTVQSILFRDVLEDVKDYFVDRFSVTHVLSREVSDLPALGGRLDGEKIDLFLRGVVPAPLIDHAFVCGPAGMIAGAERALARHGVAGDRIHVERFTTGEGAAPPRSVIERPSSRAPHAEVSAILDGICRRFPVAADETIIDAALAAGLNLPYSCRGGMCCTCRAKLTHGEVEMAVNYSLEPWELAAGYVLTCQSRPMTAEITLDFDQV